MDTIKGLFSSIGRFDTQKRSNDVIRDADLRLNELDRRRREIEARQRLLEVQATPRGKPYV